MVKLSLPLLLSLATSSTNAASLPKPPPSPSISMNLSDLYSSSSVTNTTSLSDGGSSGIDPRFGVDYQFGGIPLRPIACLMNAVNAMTNLALQDFSGAVRPVVARLPSYPDVVIRSDAVTLSPGLTPIRYVLWGIWSLALFMMKHNSFQTMYLTLGFNGAIVGYLRVEKLDAGILGMVGSEDDGGVGNVERRSDGAVPAIPPSNILENITLIGASNGTGLSLTNTTTASNAGDLRVFINPVGQLLTVNEFFIPILASLDYVARFPSTSPVDGFRVRPADADTWIEFRDYGTQPRMEPPFFEYQWVAKALWMLPEHMAAMRGGWSEALIVIQVDGVNVGDGWLRKG